MFSVESSFALKYFVFGFKNLEKTKVVIGYYHKNKKIFVVDFNGEFTKQVKEDFVNGKIKLPYVNILGVGLESFKDIIEKQYIRDKSFSVDYMSYENEFMNVNNKLVAKNSESVSLQIGLSDGLRWNTGRLYEHCDVSFSYDDYFDDIVVDFKPFKNVEVVSYRDVQGIVEKVQDTSDVKREVSKELVLEGIDTEQEVVEAVGGDTKPEETESSKDTEDGLDFDISYFSSSIKNTERVEKEIEGITAVHEDGVKKADTLEAEDKKFLPEDVKEAKEDEEVKEVIDVTDLVETSKVEKQKDDKESKATVPHKESIKKEHKADNQVFEENDFSFGLFDWDDASDDDLGNNEVSKEVKEEDKDTDDFELPDFNFSFDD